MAFFKAKKISNGFNSWIGGLGAELPFYFYSETGKSPADFFLTSEKDMKLVDPDVTNIWNTMLGLMRKYEYKMGSFRHDLSFVPAAKAK